MLTPALLRYSNVYGIDMPSRSELVAHERDTDAIARAIGADLVIYQTLQDLIASVRQFNPDIANFDCSVFTGEYVTGGVDGAYLDHLEGLRADTVKAQAMMSTGRGAVAGTAGGVNGVGKLNVNGVNGTHGDYGSTADSSPRSARDDTVGLFNNWKG